MRREIVSWGWLYVIALFLAFPGIPQAQEIELQEGMAQGDFALWMTQAIGALPKLPPAAKAEDAIKFLGGEVDPRSGQSSGLGIIPEGGWQKDEPITKELLLTLLNEEEAEEAANLSWDELVEKVLKRVQKLFDETKQAVFRVLPATPSLPAGL